MPSDKFQLKIEVQDLQSHGTFVADYEIEVSKLTLYTGPLATITIGDPFGPNSKCLMPSQDFINQIMLNFAKAFWDVREVK